ncbi:MAG: two-component regulator propeller domain-containing protein [Blastocatellia bacterium]
MMIPSKTAPILKCFLLSLFILLASSDYAWAIDENLRVERLDQKSGLSNNSIHHIFQDKTGFIWIATEYGLDRYDGYNFKTYFHDEKDPNSLRDNNTLTIYEDKLGAIWVGTYDGFSIYNPTTDNFFIDSNPSLKAFNKDLGHVYQIYEDSTDRLWFATEKQLAYYERNSTLWKKYRLIDKEKNLAIFSIIELNDKYLWLGTSDGVWFFDKSDGSFSRYKGIGDKSLGAEEVYTFLKTPQCIWVGSRERLYQVNTAKSDGYQLIKFFEIKNVRALLLQNEVLWIGTYQEGLKCLDLATLSIKSYTYDPINPKSLIGNSVSTIFYDNRNVFWFGDAISGISKYSLYANRFQLYRNIPYNPNSLSNNYVRGIWQDEDGTLWVASQFGGLNKFDLKSKTVKHYYFGTLDTNSENNIFWNVYRDKQGVLWVGGSLRYGLQKFDEKTETFIEVENFPKERDVYLVREDSRNALWVATSRGLYIISPDRKSIKRYFSEIGLGDIYSRGEVVALLEDTDGLIWIGTEEGLATFDYRTEAFTIQTSKIPNYKAGTFITHIFEDKDHYIWLTTKGQGIYRLDKKTFSFTHEITKNDGLPHNNSYAILQDEDGYFWISTDNGIAKYDFQANKFTYFGLEDGLQDLEFNRFAWFRNPTTKEIFFGGTKGFNSFFPQQVKTNTLAPTVEVVKILINNKSILFQNALSPLKFPYNQNFITFEIAALDFNAPEKNLYSYQLIGIEENWSIVNNRREAVYTNLPPGKYTFRAKASNNHGVWCEKEIVLEFIILPPWWKTWWAYFIYLFLITSIVYKVFSFKIKQTLTEAELRETHLLAKNTLTEKALVEITSQNALSKAKLIESDLKIQILKYQLNPHFLFNAFSSIRILIKTNAPLAVIIVENLCDYMRYLLSNRQVLEVPLKDELDALKSYLAIEQVRFQNKLEISFSCEDELKNLVIPAFILQPLAENAIKYGMKTSPKPLKIEICAKYLDNYLFLSVANTGKLQENLSTNKTDDNLGVSLSIIQERLKQLYPNEDIFTLKQEDLWVKALIKIPTKQKIIKDSILNLSDS